MMARSLLTLALLLVPLTAHAVPVTFSFTGADVFGSYTLESATPATTGPDRDQVYSNAITNFVIHVGNFWTVSGTTGDIRLGLNRGEFQETWYIADLFTGRDVRLFLNIWSPTGDQIITTESLAAAEVPDTTIEGNLHELTLFDEQRTNVARRAWDARVAREADAVAVPDPPTWILLALGLIAAPLIGLRSRSSSR